MSFEYPTNFLAAVDLFVHGKSRKVSARSRQIKVSPNTNLILTFGVFVTGEEMNVRCVYQGSDVVTWHTDGTAELDHHGWQTATTKRRMNQCGFNVYQSKHEWYITTKAGTFAWGEDSRIFIDEDGLVYWESGQAHCIKAS